MRPVSAGAAGRHARFFSTLSPPASSPDAEPPALSESDFDRLADATLQALEVALTSALEESVDGLDAGLSQGVLTVSFGDARGTYVLNKQTPNRQIWWSSPISGPRRYAWDGRQWRNTRDGHDMLECLASEVTKLAGFPIQLK